MNDEQDKHDSNSIDQVISDWLDGGIDGEVLNSPQANLSSIDKQRAADLLWIHSLLQFALQHEPVRQMRRIEQAMIAIRNDADTGEKTASVATPAPRTFLSKRFRRATAWLSAAILVVCAGLWLQTMNPGRQAQAAITQIRRAAGAADDREYQVTISFADRSDSEPDAPDRTVPATLYVRGGEAFVANAPAVIRPGEIWFGRDRSGAWFKPAIGPVIAGPGALAMQHRFLRDPDDDAHYLQMTTVLDRLADHYDVRLLPEEVPPRGSLSTVDACQHVRGSLRRSASPPAWLPDQVDVHADRQNGTVIRLVLAWDHEIPSHLKVITFDFVQQSQKPDRWYRPEGRNTE